MLHEARPRFPHMRLMPFRRNGGSGTARRIGTHEARGEIVVWTDADMTYPNERIPEFVADTCSTTRTSTRSSAPGPPRRAPTSSSGCRPSGSSARSPSGSSNAKIPDLNSGLRAFRRDVSLPYLRLLPPGFSCVTTITMSFLSNQHDIDYLPIDYAKRAGVSKFHFIKDAYRYILQVLRMVMYFNPIKVLMPLALWLIAIGLVKGVYDLFAHFGRFAINTVLIFITGHAHRRPRAARRPDRAVPLRDLTPWTRQTGP